MANFCSNCGSPCDPEQSFCRKCGAPLNSTAPAPAKPRPASGDQNQGLGMKWFHFVIHYQLFAYTVFSALLIFGFFMSYSELLRFGNRGPAVHSFLSSYKTMSIVLGVMMAGLSVWGILVRQKLAGFRKDGPRQLRVFLSAVLVFSVLNLVWVMSTFRSLEDLLHRRFNVEWGDLALGGVVLISALLLVCNHLYFKKREHLFVK